MFLLIACVLDLEGKGLEGLGRYEGWEGRGG